MTQRGTNQRTVDAAALQELAAAVVHGVYRTVKACQFHADVSNDAVTSLTAAAVAAVAEYCAGAGTENVALAFLGDAVFVNRQILKGTRDTHALAIELRDLLETCEVTELTLARTIDRSAVSAFSKLLADVQRDRSLVARITSSDIPGVTAGKAKFAMSGSAREESPGQRAARTYATSVLTVQAVLADVRAGKYELPRRIKRVAQQVVARADEDARLLVALAATGGVSLDAATIAVGSAILAVAMTRQLTTDRAVLANAAMTALLYDAGRVVMGGAGDGPQRTLNDDELDRVPTRTVLALTALGRMHAPARARTALLYEVWSMRRAHRLGVVYKGRRPPTLLARIIGVARAFAELRAAGAGGGLSIDDALQMLGNRAADGTERALVKLLIGSLGIYPAGTMVTLNTGELGVVMGTPSMPLDYVRPPVKILYDAQAVLLEEPFDVDLAAPLPGQPNRFIAKSIDADEQQMKAMRSYVTAATAAKRRGALEAEAEAPPSSRSAPRPFGDIPAAQPTQAARTSPLSVKEPRIAEATLQSAVGEADELAARVTRPPMVIDASMPTHRPPKQEEARAPVVPVAIEPPKPAAAPPRRRDPRNDSAPPSSMMDELHRPVRAARPARVPLVAPVAVVAPVAAVAPVAPVPRAAPAAPLAPVDHGPDSEDAHTDSTRQVTWESLESLIKPAGRVHDRGTSPPPPSSRTPKELDAEATAPQSSRDELLAAFLADASIDGSIPPAADAAPSPTAPPPAPDSPPAKGGKRAEKVTVKRDVDVQDIDNDE